MPILEITSMKYRNISKGNAQWFMIGMRLMDQMFLDKPYNNREARLASDESTCMIASKLLNLKSPRMDREVTI